jgi:hypothetical protein
MYFLAVTIFYDYIVIFGEKDKTACLNHILRKSRNKLYDNYKKKKLFISVFNNENFLKIE